MSEQPEPAGDIRGMLSEMIQAARAEGRKEALGSVGNVVQALLTQASKTGQKFVSDGNVMKYTSGQQAALDTVLEWVRAELGEGAEA